MRIFNYLIFIILCSTVSLSAQMPVEVSVQKDNIGHVRADCPGMFAGSARLAATTAGESLNNIKSIALCAGEGVLVNHQGDFNVLEDPDLATQAGVRYAVFTAEPTTTGVIDESTLSGLSNILKLPNDNLIFAQADENGNMTIINDGTFLAAAGLPTPVQLWFAPITVHNINATLPTDFFENADACIHINSASAFSVTYLSALDFMVQQTNETSGTISVSGGISEMDGSPYTVTLTNLANNEATPLTSSGSNMVFDYAIPSANNAYRVTVSDEKGCSISRIISFRAGPPMEVHIPDTTTGRGQNICVPLTVKDFTGIGTFSFALKWNPAILEYSSISFSNPALEMGSNQVGNNTSFVDQGVIIFSWIDANIRGVDIPDDEVFMEVCFNTIGQTGERSSVFLDPYKTTPVDFTDLSSSINFSIFPGSVTIVPTDSLDFSYSACGTGPFNLDVQVFGGKGPYNYSLSGTSTSSGTDQSDQFTILGLATGAYTLQITDANGTQTQKAINIRDESGNYMISVGPNTCGSSDPNGIAYLSNPPAGYYQIEWTYNNQTYYNIDTLKNIGTGDVFVAITDDNKCKSPARRVDVPNRGINALATVVQEPSCTGDPGSVQIDITGGTPDYTVYYDGNSYTTSAGIAVPLNRTSAVYNVRDASGCAVNLPVTSSLGGGAIFTLNSGVVTDINCENQADRRGQYRGNITNGSTSSNHFKSAELFFADGTPVNGTKFIPNPLTGSLMARYLETGDYQWRIEGECAGNDTTISFSISDLTSTPPSLDATITPIGCNSSTSLGGISLEVFPASGTYTYDWSHGATTATVTDLDTGSYTVIVTDTLSKCSQSEVYTLQRGVVLSKIESTIPCDADTMINVGVTIREAYESILWDSGENTEIISVNSPGYYPFTIMPIDANCSPYRDSIHIRSQTGGIQITGLNPVLIETCSNPEGIMVAYTSIPKDGLGFSWDDGPVTLGQNDYRVFDDAVHNLKVYKDNCVAIDTNFNFTFNNLITIDSTIYDVDCFGNNNGEIILSANGGGGGGFRYEFNNSGRQDFFASYNNLTPGTYALRIIDQTPPAASPCPDVNLSITIDEPEPFTVAIDSSQVSQPACTGDANGSLMIMTIGGNPGTKDIRYTYSGGAKRTTDLFIDSLRASNYNIRVEDSLGCVATTNYLLVDREPVNFTIPPIEEPYCAGQTTTVTIGSATGGTEMDFQYSVDGGVPVPLGEPLDILAGNHEITVFDGNFCSVTNAVSIREPAPIVVSFNQPDTIQVSLGERTDISAQINGENPVTDYIWTPSPPDSLNENNTISFTAVDNVNIALEVIDSRGCVGSNGIFVLVRKKRDVGIPNAFSPNGDGRNDLLTIVPGPAVRSIKKFQVYDRYGTLMWEESDISPAQAQITGWDGTYSGTPAMFDVYVTLVKVEYIDGEVIQRITDVTLIK